MRLAADRQGEWPRRHQRGREHVLLCKSCNLPAKSTMNRLRYMTCATDQVRLVLAIMTNDIEKRHSSSAPARRTLGSYIAADRIDISVKQLLLGPLQLVELGRRRILQQSRDGGLCSFGGRIRLFGSSGRRRCRRSYMLRLRNSSGFLGRDRLRTSSRDLRCCRSPGASRFGMGSSGTADQCQGQYGHQQRFHTTPPTHAVLTPAPLPTTSLRYFFGPRYCAS